MVRQDLQNALRIFFTAAEATERGNSINKKYLESGGNFYLKVLVDAGLINKKKLQTGYVGLTHLGRKLYRMTKE
ncbi:MAG: hypothetical protein V1678_00995 [Candidatus Aenigmatarchaeota archaeon]